MHNTVVIGPFLNMPAPGFTIRDHQHHSQTLGDVMGKHGLLLGFIGDVWQPASVRRILWLQRHAGAFMRSGVNLALLICDQPHMLYGFRVSSPIPLEFPLLADVNHEVHKLYNMDLLSGLVLIDSDRMVRAKWLVPDERVWPQIGELLDAVQSIAEPVP